MGGGRVCGLSPSEWGLPAKVFCFASIFVNKWTDVLAILDIFHNYVILILKPQDELEMRRISPSFHLFSEMWPFCNSFSENEKVSQFLKHRNNHKCFP